VAVIVGKGELLQARLYAYLCNLLKIFYGRLGQWTFIWASSKQARQTCWLELTSTTPHRPITLYQSLVVNE